MNVEYQPFELEAVDLVPDKLDERREFRPRTHTGRIVLGESFLGPRRSGKHDINLEGVGSPRSAQAAIQGSISERKDDKQIGFKASERAGGRNPILTSTPELRIPNRAGSRRARMKIAD